LYSPPYPQINAIPGTSVTTSDTVAIVNCTSLPVTIDFLTYRMPDGPTGPCTESGVVGVLQPGNCFIHDGSGSCSFDPLTEYWEIVYTFSQQQVVE